MEGKAIYKQNLVCVLIWHSRNEHTNVANMYHHNVHPNYLKK